MSFPQPAAAQAQSPFPASLYPWEQVANPTPVPLSTPPSTPATQPAPSLLPGQELQLSSPIALTAERQITRHSMRAMPAAEPRGLLGFVIAGLCVATGGLLLVFVYFLGLSLPQTNSLSVSAVTPGVTRAITPPPTLAPSPMLTSSPTQSVFPGQQYISNPQTASSINTITAQPLQTSSTFQVNQKIYVTFDIHTNGKSGAVCLSWFLNNHQVTRYAFPVSAGAGSGYSYAIFGGAGPSYVQISWASTTTCSDAMLAQQVAFTVTR